MKNAITLILLLFTIILQAQEITVSGTVVDENNLPLPGATVLVKGTTNGTSTDFDGKYSIKAQNGDKLAFSYVGYFSIEVIVSNDNINGKMKPKMESKDFIPPCCYIRNVNNDNKTYSNTTLKWSRNTFHVGR